MRGGHLGGAGSYATAIRMVEQKRVPAKEMVTHTLALKDFRAGIDLVDKSSESIKVVLIPE